MDARVWRVGALHANLVGRSVGWLVLKQYLGVQYHKHHYAWCTWNGPQCHTYGILLLLLKSMIGDVVSYKLRCVRCSFVVFVRQFVVRCSLFVVRFVLFFSSFCCVARQLVRCLIISLLRSSLVLFVSSFCFVRQFLLFVGWLVLFVRSFVCLFANAATKQASLPIEDSALHFVSSFASSVGSLCSSASSFLCLFANAATKEASQSKIQRCSGIGGADDNKRTTSSPTMPTVTITTRHLHQLLRHTMACRNSHITNADEGQGSKEQENAHWGGGAMARLDDRGCSRSYE